MPATCRDAPVLKREIGLFGATALGIGAIIGSGIFIVTGIVAGVAGPAMVVSVILAGIIAVFSAGSVAELAAYLPEEGGTYAYARRLLSPFAGFIAGWIWVFANVFVGAAVALGFAHYLAVLLPGTSVPFIAVAVCLVFTALNYRWAKGSVLFNDVLVVLKVVILFVFVAAGLLFFRPDNFVPFAPSGSAGIFSGAALIFFAYTGFARVTLVAEEVRDPVVTIPRSIFLALGISAALYLLVSAIAVGLAGDAALAGSGAPLADAIRVTGNVPVLMLVTAGAMIATASVLLTTILGISRIVFAMSRNRDLPGFLSAIHPRFCTPHTAIAVTGAGMVAVILLADLTLAVSVSTFAMLAFYLIADLAALRLPWQARRYPAWVPAIGAASCAGLAVFLSRTSVLIGCAGLVAGGALYLAIRWRDRRQNRQVPDH